LSDTIVVPQGGLSFVTPEGRVLLRISGKEEGGEMVLCNSRGAPVVVLRATDDGAQMIMFDAAQKVGVTMGQSVLLFCNHQENPVVEIGLATNGGVISVGDNQGNPLWVSPERG
jgi:hypothetical protein